MALSDDQKAMLRLLAQREQGYEDIAALMGLSVDEVRAKVKDGARPSSTRPKASRGDRDACRRAASATAAGPIAPPEPPQPAAAGEPRAGRRAGAARRRPSAGDRAAAAARRSRRRATPRAPLDPGSRSAQGPRRACAALGAGVAVVGRRS